MQLLSGFISGAIRAFECLSFFFIGWRHIRQIFLVCSFMFLLTSMAAFAAPPWHPSSSWVPLAWVLVPYGLCKVMPEFCTVHEYFLCPSAKLGCQYWVQIIFHLLLQTFHLVFRQGGHPRKSSIWYIVITYSNNSDSLNCTRSQAWMVMHPKSIWLPVC